MSSDPEPVDRGSIVVVVVAVCLIILVVGTFWYFVIYPSLHQTPEVVVTETSCTSAFRSTSSTMSNDTITVNINERTVTGNHTATTYGTDGADLGESCLP